MLYRIRNHSGRINRTVALLLVLIAVMLVIIAIPAWKVFRYRSEKTGCVQAMKSAKDGLIIEYLGRFDAGTVEEAMVALDEIMPGRANLCPAGGTVYLIRGDHDIFEPVCGLHDDDLKLRVRLNASRALDLLEEGLPEARRDLGEEPESVAIALNGKSLECVRVEEEPPIRRGTGTTNGYEGVVAFYRLDDEGEISYFIYADEHHCAIWRKGQQWRGDAYDD